MKYTHTDLNDFVRDNVVPHLLKSQEHEQKREFTDKENIRFAILKYCGESSAPPKIIEADHHIEEIFGKKLEHLLPTMKAFAMEEIRKAQEYWMNSPMNSYVK